MTLPAPTYDLVLLLDPQAEESVRAKILADTRATIEAHGELLRHDEWGERQLTYPIEKKTSAEYHLLQFHAGTVELLAELDRTLRITDGVMRFRLIKLRPGVPDAPDMRSSSAPARRVETEVHAESQPDGEVEVEVDLVAAEPA
jgi:small subunit ribosomal protein S6